MPDILLTLSANVPEARLSAITCELARDISRQRVPARLVDAALAPGERGDPVTLGVIATSLITSGAVTAFIECLKAYLSRERTLGIKVTQPDGMSIEITSKNIDTAAVRETLQRAVSKQG